MPNVPGWFEYLTYFDNKLAQLQQSEPDANWTPQSLTAAFVADGFPVNNEGMYSHFQQYGNTVAENISPNGYFEVDYYMNSKLALMRAENPDYNMSQLESAFQAANLTAWDHYTLYGFKEGVNPSAQFNTDDYMDAKLAQMRISDPNYTMTQLDQAFRDADLNPIEHWVLYGRTENLSYTPGTEAIPYIDVPLVAGTDTYTGGEGNENFIGTVGGSKATLTQNTTIDGAAGEDMLTVDLNGNWSGFGNKGGVTGVETVTINNDSNSSYNFNTTGIKGADTYNVNGTVNLTNLAETGITVNLADVHAANGVNVGFARDVASNPADALTLGLSNVNIPSRINDQVQSPVAIKAQGIEDVTINSTGNTSNLVDLSGIDFMRSLDVTGNANLTVNTDGTDFTTIDAGTATGNVTITATGRTITNAVFGTGNDTLNNNVAPTAELTGGDGQDTVNITQANGSYALVSTGVENLGIVKNAGNVTLIGENVNGLDKLILNSTNNTGNGIVLGQFANSELSVEAVNANLANLTIADISAIDFKIGDGLRSTSDSFTGNLIVDANNLTLDVDDGTGIGAMFEGQIHGKNITDLDLNAGRNANLVVESGGDLNDVSNITASGYGNIVLQAGTELATSAQALYVNTIQMSSGNFTAFFGKNAGNDGVLNLVGSSIASHNISVDGTYESVSLQTGMGDDIISIDTTNLTHKLTLSGDLGGGTNKLLISGPNANLVDTDGLTWEGHPNISTGSLVPNGGSINVAGTSTILLTGSGRVNLTAQNAVANIIASDDGGTINVNPAIGGTKANVSLGAGADVVSVATPDTAGTKSDGTNYRYNLTTVDNFNPGEDTISNADYAPATLDATYTGTGVTNNYSDWSVSQSVYTWIGKATGITPAAGSLTFAEDNSGGARPINQQAVIWDENGSAPGLGDGGTLFIFAGDDGATASVVKLAGVALDSDQINDALVNSPAPGVV